MKKRNKRTRLCKSAYFRMYKHPTDAIVSYMKQDWAAHEEPAFVELSYEEARMIFGF